MQGVFSITEVRVFFLKTGFFIVLEKIGSRFKAVAKRCKAFLVSV